MATILLILSSMVFAQAQESAPKPVLEDISVQGVINGINCFARSTFCPIDHPEHMSIHVAMEQDWVLMTGSDIFHLANVRPEVQILNIGKDVKVTGKVEKTSHSIFVFEMQRLMKNGKWKTIWTEKDQIKEIKEASWFKLEG